MRRIAFLLLLIASVAGAQDYTQYNTFKAYCEANFIDSPDSLLAVWAGTETAIGDSIYVYESVNSAAIGWDVNLPCEGWVEYGATTAYGDTTGHDDGNYFVHLRHVTGLTDSTEYHYRIVCVDADSDTTRTNDATFTTVSGGGWTAIDGTSPPYLLNSAGTTYYLTGDITSDTQGLRVDAANVTIDLNGHTIIYDNGTPAFSIDYDTDTYQTIAYNTNKSVGVAIEPNRHGTSIFNGTIKQGATQSRGIGLGGFNPILARGDMGEVAGLSIEWGGEQNSCTVGFAKATVHNCVFKDIGTLVNYRDSVLGAVRISESVLGGVTGTASYNLVKRTRQGAIVGAQQAWNNECRVDSWCTNAGGIYAQPNGSYKHNRIFGTGYHMFALGWALVDYCDSLTYRDNYAHMMVEEPDSVRYNANFPNGTDVGFISSANGFRITQYDGSSRAYNNYLVTNNTLIVEAQDGATTARGIEVMANPYVVNFRSIGNTVKVVQVSGSATKIACAVIQGQNTYVTAGTEAPALFIGDTYIGNQYILRFGDNYGSGGGGSMGWFRDCTLIGTGARDDFGTAFVGYGGGDSKYNKLLNCTYSGQADPDDSSWDTNTSPHLEYLVGHRVWIKLEDAQGDSLVGQAVTLQDDHGDSHTDTTGTDGVAVLHLIDYDWTAPAGNATASKNVHSGWELVWGENTAAINSNHVSITDNEANPLVYSGEGGGQQEDEVGAPVLERNGTSLGCSWAGMTAAPDHYVLIVYEDDVQKTVYVGDMTSATVTIKSGVAVRAKVQAVSSAGTVLSESSETYDSGL